MDGIGTWTLAPSHVDAGPARPAIVSDGSRDGSSSEAHWGPGWFESSWDLQHGLEVHEGLLVDCCWQEWIESWLRG